MELKGRGKTFVFLLVVALFAWPGYQAMVSALPPGALGPTEASRSEPSAAQAVTIPEATPIPTPTATPRPTSTPTKKFPGGSPLEMASIEEWVIHLTNDERVKAGLRPFDHDPDISDIARKHSGQMVLHGLQSHDKGQGPHGQGPGGWLRLPRLPRGWFLLLWA